MEIVRKGFWADCTKEINHPPKPHHLPAEEREIELPLARYMPSFRARFFANQKGVMTEAGPPIGDKLCLGPGIARKVKVIDWPK